MTYDETMAWGAAQYNDVTARLGTRGLPAAFVQTGGMCAAIEVQLESGYTLLITDAEDSLSWDRPDQVGWWVGMYAPPDEWDGPLAYAQNDNTQDVDVLLTLVDDVLREGVNARRQAR